MSYTCSTLTCFHVKLRGESIPIRFHITFPLFLLSTLLPAASISTTYLLFCFFLYGLIQFSTVLFHEMGHAYAALLLHCSIGQILLWPLGGICYIGRNAATLTPKQDILIGTYFSIYSSNLYIYLLRCNGDLNPSF